jgi:glycosyltransferase involved in cell wall biosynthesis
VVDPILVIRITVPVAAGRPGTFADGAIGALIQIDQRHKSTDYESTMSARAPNSGSPQHTAAVDVIVVDPNLRDTLGHYLQYDAAVVKGLRAVGAQPILLAHRAVLSGITNVLGAQPAFRDDIWTGSGRGGPWSTAKANFRFLSDLLHAVRRQHLGPHVVCFVHSFVNRQFFALVLLPLLLIGRRSWGFIYLFRYQADFYHGRLARFSFRLLALLARWRSVRLASDSNRLAADLQALTRLPVELLPIPHVPPFAEPRAASHDRRCHFVSLGNARDEKGILEIFAAIRWLRDNDQLQDCRFTLQCNDATPEVTAAVTAFRDLNLPGCRLLFSALATVAYYDLLSQADIVLLPYWRSIYASRTSGVFMDALSAGKPVVVTENTWMADQLARHGAGLLCGDRDPVVLGRAIMAARERRADLVARATERRAAWTELHNPEALARRIVQSGDPAPERRVAMIYPWSDLADPRGGAGQRCRLLLEFLNSQPIELQVMMGGDAPPHRRDNCSFASLGRPTTPIRAARLILRLAMRLRYGSDGRNSDWLAWEFLRARFDPGLRRRLRKALPRGGTVLLEYPFWASVVIPEAHRTQCKVVVTCHDILSDQPASSPAWRQLIRQWEMKAFLAADAVVAVSHDDLVLLTKRGIRAHLAPNPVDTRLFTPSLSDPLSRFAAEPLNFPYRKIALFVGSRHPPNICAVKFLRNIATQLAAIPEATDIGIVVVGTCAAPERNNRFLALGPVNQQRLLELYRIASVAVIPLPNGTGASLKTIEAMAAGLPVLGTPAAFRGLSVVDGETALVEIEPNRFATRLVELLHDEPRLTQIAVAARQFAVQFDYRLSFLPYLSILGLTEAASNAAREIEPHAH